MTRCWLLCTGLLMLAATSLAAPTAPSATASQEPVQITADRLEADEAAKTLIFIGNAVAKQGDVTIHGDRLHIFTAAGGSDVERIVAEGNVRIEQGQRLATSGRADYLRAEERIVLTGAPRVSEGQNSVQGQEIVLFLKENRSVVKSGQGGRVNAVFTPRKQGAP
jgi:lipopolysaccharide export system protein LptA